MSQRRNPVRWLALRLLFCVALSFGCVSAKPFAIVVLPDTQNYADARRDAQGKRAILDYSRHFYSQTQWVKENRDKLNIAMVAHVGDVVQTDHPDEWKIADKAFKTIDGAVPYVLAPGNHDFRTGRAGGRETRLNDYFPPSRFEKQSWYAGHYGKGNENNCALFEAGGMKFLILSLEFAPRDEVLAWANGIVARHPERRCIVVTHAYLDNGRRIAHAAMGYGWKGNSAEQMWQKFVSRHKNIFLVLSGHAVSCRLSSVGKHGNTVHQIQSDYQFLAEGGQGYLRLMRFRPGENRIDVQTYSPALNRNATASRDAFSLNYDMGGKTVRKRSK
jgi:3',5'-cyclic AMP phosphodiesterase CpdA